MRGKLKLPDRLTRDYFAERAGPVKVRLSDDRGKAIAESRELKPSSFSTGSLGWALHERMLVRVGDVMVWVQVNLTMTVCGSKELPRGEPPATLPAAS